MKRKGFVVFLAGAILLAAGCTRVDDSAPHHENSLTGGEADTLRTQIESCWQVPTSVRDPKELIVVLAVQVNKDRTVKSAVVVDAARLETDRDFRAMAESAMRAILSAKCSPLKLPSEKYEEWKEITMTFDPS